MDGNKISIQPQNFLCQCGPRFGEWKLPRACSVQVERASGLTYMEVGMDTGEWILECMKEKKRMPSVWWVAVLILLWLAAAFMLATSSFAETDDQIADAIYIAEGGAKTNHPYGILARYKTTTPRQACLNTIKSARKRYAAYTGSDDFITFLGRTYCPPEAHPLNRNWVKNVKGSL